MPPFSHASSTNSRAKKPILRHLGRRYTRKFATTRLAPSENTEMCCGTSHSHATAAWTSTATRIKITRPSRQRRFQTSVRVWKNVRNEQWMLFHSEPLPATRNHSKDDGQFYNANGDHGAWSRESSEMSGMKRKTALRRPNAIILPSSVFSRAWRFSPKTLDSLMKTIH